MTGRETHCPPCAKLTTLWGLYDTSLTRAHGTFAHAWSSQCPAAISNRNDEKSPFLAHCSSPSACSWDDYYDHLTSSTSQLFVAVPDVPRSEHPYQSTCCSSLPRTCAVFTALPAPIAIPRLSQHDIPRHDHSTTLSCAATLSCEAYYQQQSTFGNNGLSQLYLLFICGEHQQAACLDKLLYASDDGVGALPVDLQPHIRKRSPSSRDPAEPGGDAYLIQSTRTARVIPESDPLFAGRAT